MTLVELQKVLGEQIAAVRCESLSPDAKKDVYTQSEYVAKLAKQMINNADVVLRSEKLRAEGFEMSQTEMLVDGGRWNE